MTPETLQALLPLATDWVAKQEKEILSLGEPLSDQLLADASAIGVQHPERVRILHVDEIPQPENTLLRNAARAMNFLTPATLGMALRYGILVNNEMIGGRELLVHELVHTAQYERFGSIAAFLQQYLYECISVGYENAPLEIEAVETAAAICS